MISVSLTFHRRYDYSLVRFTTIGTASKTRGCITTLPTTYISGPVGHLLGLDLGGIDHCEVEFWFGEQLTICNTLKMWNVPNYIVFQKR